MEEFKVNNGNSGERLDIFLAGMLHGRYSRSRIKSFIDEKYILLNGNKAKGSYRLRNNDTIKFTPPPKPCHNIIPEDIPIEILYQDDDIVVVNKPCGMVVHPALGNSTHTLVNALLFHCNGTLASPGSPLRPGVVHRLDKDVSGIILLAKSDEAYLKLVKLFKDRLIKRRYVAFVSGRPPLNTNEIVLPIGRSRRDRKKMAVVHDDNRSKYAITFYRVVKTFIGFSKLEITLGTGRTHQIRVHTAHIGHPILGDAKYGGQKKLSDGRRIKRIMLHAKSLKFNHPITEKEIFLETDLPAEFIELENG